MRLFPALRLALSKSPGLRLVFLASVGGAAFDALATYWAQPHLLLEGNPLVRSLLTQGIAPLAALLIVAIGLMLLKVMAVAFLAMRFFRAPPGSTFSGYLDSAGVAFGRAASPARNVHSSKVFEYFLLMLLLALSGHIYAGLENILWACCGIGSTGILIAPASGGMAWFPLGSYLFGLVFAFLAWLYLRDRPILPVGVVLDDGR